MAVDTQEATVADEAYLRPLPPLAQRKKTWAPDLLAGVFWRGLTNLGTHRKVLQLLKHPLLAETARTNPRFAYKYLTHDYLVRDLTTGQRAASFVHHYRRLTETLPASTLRQCLREFIRLHEIPAEGNRFTITMGLSRDFDKEGEFSLNLHVDSEVVFLLSFTIVPGATVNSSSPEVLLISRLQGMKGSYHLIHLATKSLHNVAPDAVLLAALQGIALAFGISEIAAVSASRQSSCTSDSAAAFQQAYDLFFEGLDIERSSDGFYRTPVPIEPKPLAHVKKGHKIRTKEKRAFKLAVQTACCEFLLREMPRLSD